MTDAMIMLFLGFIAVLISVLTPVIKVNSNLVRLNTTLENFENEYKRNHERLESRVSKHGAEIDELKEVTTKHDIRLTNLEKEE